MDTEAPENIQDSTNPIVWTHAKSYIASAGIQGYKIRTDVGDGLIKEISHLLLTTQGRTSGIWYRTVLMFDYHEGNPFVLCSNGGKADYSDWYKNIEKNPRVWVQIERDKFWADCEIINNSNHPELKDYLISKLNRTYPRYREFESMCPQREVPAIIIKRV